MAPKQEASLLVSQNKGFVDHMDKKHATWFLKTRKQGF